jgi:hypothetical protein
MFTGRSAKSTHKIVSNSKSRINNSVYLNKEQVIRMDNADSFKKIKPFMASESKAKNVSRNMPFFY